MSPRMPIVGDHILYETSNGEHRNGDVLFPALVVHVHTEITVDLCVMFPFERASLRYEAHLLGSPGCGPAGWCWPPP